MEYKLHYVLDEKDEELGFDFFTHKSHTDEIKLFLKPKEEETTAFIQIVAKSTNSQRVDLLYSLPVSSTNSGSRRIFNISLILQPDIRYILINGYKVNLGRYEYMPRSHSKSGLVIADFLAEDMKTLKFDKKKWKKEEEEYNYLINISKKDNTIKNVLDKCGIIA